MLHIAICDDEKYMLNKLENLIRKFFHTKNTEINIAKFFDGRELTEYSGPIDILFLDIQMNKMDGMETAKKLRSAGFNGFLIFVTILKELVFQAFEVQAFDYLLKPIDKDAFDKMMNRLFHAMRNAKDNMLLVHMGTESRLVPFDTIVYCEVIDKKIYLHLNSGQVVAYYDKIENLETKLDGRFFKCHRSYLVNLQYLNGFKNGVAYMNTGASIPVSRLRNKEFASVVLQYMKEWR